MKPFLTAALVLITFGSAAEAKIDFIITKCTVNKLTGMEICITTFEQADRK